MNFERKDHGPDWGSPSWRWQLWWIVQLIRWSLVGRTVPWKSHWKNMAIRQYMTTKLYHTCYYYVITTRSWHDFLFIVFKCGCCEFGTENPNVSMCSGNEDGEQVWVVNPKNKLTPRLWSADDKIVVIKDVWPNEMALLSPKNARDSGSWMWMCHWCIIPLPVGVGLEPRNILMRFKSTSTALLPCLLWTFLKAIAVIRFVPAKRVPLYSYPVWKSYSCTFDMTRLRK